MFPRSYFAGRMFAPRYFPESEGEVATSGLVCGTVTVAARVDGRALAERRVAGAASVAARVDGKAFVEKC